MYGADSTSYKIGINESPPFTMLNQHNKWEGISVWLWEQIAEEENLSFEYVIVAKNSLDAEQIDLFIHPIIIDKHNIDQLDFTPPYYATNSTVLINRIYGFQFAWNFIKSILSVNFLKLVIAIFILLMIMGLIVWQLEKKANPTQFNSGLKGVGNGIWWSAVTLSTVGYGDIAPKTLAGRIVGTFWMFAGILVVSAFTASMASLLTINQISTRDGSINDFKHQHIGVLDQSTTHAYLKNNFFKNITPVEHLSEGIIALQNHQIDAFMGDEPTIMYIIEEDSLKNCSLLRHKFNAQYYSFGVAKYNPHLNNIVSKSIIEIVNSVEWQLLLEEYEIDYE